MARNQPTNKHWAPRTGWRDSREGGSAAPALPRNCASKWSTRGTALPACSPAPPCIRPPQRCGRWSPQVAAGSGGVAPEERPGGARCGGKGGVAATLRVIEPRQPWASLPRRGLPDPPASGWWSAHGSLPTVANRRTQEAPLPQPAPAPPIPPYSPPPHHLVSAPPPHLPSITATNQPTRVLTATPYPFHFPASPIPPPALPPFSIPQLSSHHRGVGHGA